MITPTVHRLCTKPTVWGFLLILALFSGDLLLTPTTLFASTTYSARAQAENTYTVRPGDTVTNIANRFGLTVEELMELNGLRNANFLYIGQRLIVPAETTTEETNSGPQTVITPTTTLTDVTSVAPLTGTVGLTTTPAVTALADISTAVTGVVTAPITTSVATTQTVTTEVVRETAVMTTAVTSTSAMSTTTYTVQRGETLYMIAARFNTTPALIADLNGLRNLNLLTVGQELVVPFIETAAEPDPTPTATAEPPTPTSSPIPPSPTPFPSPTPSPTPTLTPEPEALTTTYTVRVGDTLSSIAARFGTTTGELLRLNRLANANYISVGQRLVVPIQRDEETAAVIDPTRIQFPAGGTSATVDGTLIFPDQACYVLEATAGQEMTVSVDSDGDLANVWVRAAERNVNGGLPLKGLENEARTWSSALPVTGDYLICVAVPEGAVLYTLTVSIPAACRSVTQAIQTVDWETFLQSDSALAHETIGGDHYVTVVATTVTDAIGTSGIPQIDQIVYGDFDGDCEEEAGVPLFSGGTAGNVGYLVYDEQTREDGVTLPVLVAWGDGYKLGLAADGGILIVSNALYNGWEPNCCPSGRAYDSYRLTDGGLTLVATTTEGFAEAQVPTVVHFYNLLQSRSYTEAYALLSPSLQAANPYESWVVGYADTEAIDATLEPDPETPDRLLADLRVTERLSSGTARIRHYSGYWDLTWSGDAPGWILEEGSFTVVP